MLLGFIGVLVASCVVVFGGCYYSSYRTLPWGPDYFKRYTFATQYESHCSQRSWSNDPITTQLDFSNFLHLLQVNPDRWEWNYDAMRLWYQKDDEGYIQVVFSKKDFVRFRKWLYAQHKNASVHRNSEQHKIDAFNCQTILETAQRDIDRIREAANIQIQEARDIVDNIDNSIQAHSVLYQDDEGRFYIQEDGRFLEVVSPTLKTE